MATALGSSIRLAGAHSYFSARTGLPGDLRYRRHPLAAEATGESEESPAPGSVSFGSINWFSILTPMRKWDVANSK